MRMKNESKLVVGVAAWLGLLFLVVGTAWHTAVSSQDPITERVSIRTDGGQANNHSERPAISADGRFVAFASTADNLVPNDTNNASDIFVYDRQTGAIERVSVRSDGGQANFGSFAPAISADGNIVVFHSYATNLYPGDTNNVADVFAHDRTTSQTELISRVIAGVANDISFEPDVSTDGRYVTFWSHASNLVGGDTNGAADVFWYDRLAQTMFRVSVDSNGEQGNDDSLKPRISGNGQRIVFESYASNLVPGDGNGYKDIFVHDRSTGHTQRVSVSSVGAEANGESSEPAISANGEVVAFVSLANNLVANDNNGLRDVFVRHLPGNQTTLASLNTAGQQTNGLSLEPALSADGRYVTFRSQAANLADPPAANWQIYRRDRLEATTVRVSLSSAGHTANGDSMRSALSASGRFITFASEASNLVASDTNERRDIFVRDQSPPPPPTPTPSPTPPPPPPTLTINRSTGQPGSSFFLTGANWEANTAVTVFVNNQQVGSLNADGAGDIAFRLQTDAAAGEGSYLVTAVQGQTGAGVSYRLDAGEPLRPQTGFGPIFNVPASVIPLTPRIYLPFVAHSGQSLRQAAEVELLKNYTLRVTTNALAGAPTAPGRAARWEHRPQLKRLSSYL
jgi:hypothetical protein